MEGLNENSKWMGLMTTIGGNGRDRVQWECKYKENDKETCTR